MSNEVYKDLNQVAEIIKGHFPVGADVCTQAADHITNLEAENAILRESIKAGGEVSKRGVKRIAELEKDVESLEEDNQELVYDCRDWRIKCEKLKAQNAKLVEEEPDGV